MTDVLSLSVSLLLVQCMRRCVGCVWWRESMPSERRQGRRVIKLPVERWSYLLECDENKRERGQR